MIWDWRNDWEGSGVASFTSIPSSSKSGIVQILAARRGEAMINAKVELRTQVAATSELMDGHQPSHGRPAAQEPCAGGSEAARRGAGDAPGSGERSDSREMLSSFVSGCVAGLCQSIVLIPSDNIKIRLQVLNVYRLAEACLSSYGGRPTVVSW